MFVIRYTLVLNIHRKIILLPVACFLLYQTYHIDSHLNFPSFRKGSKIVRLKIEKNLHAAENRCPVFIFSENSPSPSKHVQHFPQAWLLNISSSTFSSSFPLNLNSTFDVRTYCCYLKKMGLKVFKTNLDRWSFD